MHGKLCRAVTFIILGIAPGALAQEGSQKVQVQSSQLNLRMIGSAAITNPIGSKLRSQCHREFTTTGQQSQLVQMHYLAHHWGRVLAQKTLDSAALQPLNPPSVTPLPVIGPDIKADGNWQTSFS